VLQKAGSIASIAAKFRVIGMAYILQPSFHVQDRWTLMLHTHMLLRPVGRLPQRFLSATAWFLALESAPLDLTAAQRPKQERPQREHISADPFRILPKLL
jgi:hypothetical protein